MLKSNDNNEEKERAGIWVITTVTRRRSIKKQ
jgi:hypothetical protein